ncbi:hypothetical protein EJD97_023925 [Solanum chilense]|uniref:Uncharacterized protein n=1 Tax=Solanum chilense TaxID=4083 RepID=A0A6N2ARJ7_SOLCI|nr:hypothetical protein EJD97_023925 [Solanum chilense]
MGDNNEEIDMNDVVVARPAAADKNELIMQLMRQIAEMSVEMQRMQDLPNPISSFNPPRDGRPPLHFPPPSTEQVQNLLSNPAQNPPTIDSTTPIHRHATASCQAPHHPHNTNQILQLTQNKNTNNAQTFPHLQNQNIDPQNCPQNYQATQNTQNPSIVPPLLQKTTFQIPTSNEPYVDCSELDHCKEQERQWRSKEEAVKLNMKEEIRKAMKELHYIFEVDGLRYKDLCIHPNLDLPEGFKVPKGVANNLVIALLSLVSKERV